MDLNDAILFTQNWLEAEQEAEGINLHSFDGNTDAGEYYIHMIPRITYDLEDNDKIYAMINQYDKTILEKFK